MHLQHDELVDLAEGTRAESSVPHLAACEACRHQLAELKAMMSAAADVAVPEPSPLFWDHFSARVRRVPQRLPPQPSRCPIAASTAHRPEEAIRSPSFSTAPTCSPPTQLRWMRCVRLLPRAGSTPKPFTFRA